MNTLSTAVPCQYSGVSYDADGTSLHAYVSPLDDTSRAVIEGFAQAHPNIRVTPRAGAQPEAVGELQRARVSPVLDKHHATGGIGVRGDGSIEVTTSAPTDAEAKQLESDLRAAVAMKTPLEQHLPAAEPNLDITVGGPRFSPN